MGMSTAGGHKGGRRGRRGVPRYSAMADINMTPFIDVMLVLLIIFMVAAPLLSTGVPINLPQTAAGALNVDHKPVQVAVDDKGMIYIDDKPVDEADFIARLQQLAPDAAKERIYLRGATSVSYGRIAAIMALMTKAGYKRVALVTQPIQK
ncbi:MAG: biopolymer transporter ExbD [Hyphomicrobiales bacterium]|nr:biopolymer transporter ExbD [Hyphomicrobiales bacterium]